MAQGNLGSYEIFNAALEQFLDTQPR